MGEGVLAPKLCDSINFSSESAEEFGAGVSPKTRACEGLVMQTCKDVRMQNVILNLIIVMILAFLLGVRSRTFDTLLGRPQTDGSQEIQKTLRL